MNADRSGKAGKGPGALVHIGPDRQDEVHIDVISYHQDDCTTHANCSPQDLKLLCQKDKVSWINVDGIHDAGVIEHVGQSLNIHILILEDIMNSAARPKVEFFGDFFFVSLKMMEWRGYGRPLELEQLSLVIREDSVVMFQERPGDYFDEIRDRIQTSKGRVRSKNGYYLAYLIMDHVIDNYIVVSDKLADRIQQLETMVMRKPNEHILKSILGIRKELIDFKRSVDPLKEAVNAISREMDHDMSKYYRDLYDHIIHESENLSMYREMVANLLELYHSHQSMKMNQVMKVLTIITTIFAPLTFVVGVYGMNFEYMPELKYHMAYPIVLASMLALVLIMLLIFRRKKWL